MASVFALPLPLQALMATTFTYGLTALGAALVFIVPHPSRRLMDGMMALGAGIMLASSFWSLLDPGISLAASLGQAPWLIMSLGFLAGALFLILADRLSARLFLSPGRSDRPARTRLLLASITLHNIPEGLAVGVAFGALALTSTGALLRSAWMLAVGIGIQNFPEGAAVSFPLMRDGCTRRRAFHWGHLSGLVEPAAGFVGVLVASSVQGILPFLLAFAAGAMIYVVISELLPENHRSKDAQLLDLVTMAGFVVMMVLDIAFG